MDIISRLRDERIGADNLLLEMGLAEYIDLVSANLATNEFQRKRVSSSKTVYSLLKSDLKTGCVVPPIVLALATPSGSEPGSSSDAVVNEASIIAGRESLVILDGLQRTHTIMDLLSELERNDDPEMERVRQSKLRVEIYVGLNRIGILYRMLTLNTGQTPMSLRQQIEMLYSDYAGSSNSGIDLIRESEDRRATQPNQYAFKDVVEGFNAFLNRDELPFDRAGLLENIRSLEKLSRLNQESDIFQVYAAQLDSFIQQADSLVDGAQLPSNWRDSQATPFGRTVQQLFKKAQAMSGFGAAIGKLIDREILSSLEDAGTHVANIRTDNPEEFLINMNDSLDWIKNNTSKIGNAQRNFFTFFFRDLLNPDSDSYLVLELCAESALRKYQDQNM